MQAFATQQGNYQTNLMNSVEWKSQLRRHVYVITKYGGISESHCATVELHDARVYLYEFQQEVIMDSCGLGK